MHTACLVFSQVPMDIKKFDILNDVQEKLDSLKNTNSDTSNSICLYDYYRFGFGKVGFLFSTFTSIADTIWSNPRNAFIEPLCEMEAKLEQYTKSNDNLEYDVKTNFDFVERINFEKSLDKKSNSIFHYITHDGKLHEFPFEYQMNLKLPENIRQFEQFKKEFLDYVTTYQNNNPKYSLFVTVVNCHH